MQNIDTILLVLEKAEQILSLVNLPDSTVKKYNELKELTCIKLGIEYFPLRKSSNLYNTYSSYNNDNNSNNKDNYINNYRDISYKKSLIIDYLMEIINKSYNTQDINYNTNNKISNLFNKYNLLDPNVIDYNHDLNLEENNLKEKVINIEYLIDNHSKKKEDYLKVSKIINYYLYFFIIFINII